MDRASRTDGSDQGGKRPGPASSERASPDGTDFDGTDFDSAVLEAAFSVSPHPIGITELTTGKLVEVNRAFSTIFGHSRAEALGRSTTELGMWQNPEQRNEFVRQLRESGRVVEMCVPAMAKGGRPLNTRLSAEIVTLRGKPHAITYVRDETAQVRAEAERAALSEQLRQVQKMESLGTLAGGIAHDFNNIVMAILAVNELIDLDAESPTLVREHLAELKLATTRASDLIRQILTFARRRGDERVPTDLAQPVSEALKLLQAALPKSIRIDARLEPDTPMVLADPGQVHQIIMNLGTNAAHAMVDTRGVMTVTLDPVRVEEEYSPKVSATHERTYVRITVQDTGEGMSREIQARIFEPFFTTKAKGKGTGLGLAMVDGIMQGHDGYLRVESSEGEGTTFELYFPAWEGEPQIAAPPTTELARGRGQRILLVDDEPMLCDFVSQLLERFEYRVRSFSSPSQALECFRSDPQAFDLVLTDLNMPDLTGAELAEAVLELRPELPVIVMTAVAGRWNWESLSGIGVRDLLTKPFGQEGLLRSLALALLPHESNA